MKKILMTLMAVVLTIGYTAAQEEEEEGKKKGKKGKGAGAAAEEPVAAEDWKGPYPDIIIPSKISRVMTEYREKAKDFDEMLIKYESKKQRKIRDWRGRHEPWVEKYVKIVQRETKLLSTKAEELDKKLDKLAALEEEFFDDKEKMKDIQKQTADITSQRAQYDGLVSEYMDYPNACWPPEARDKKLFNWTPTNPHNTVAKSPSISGEQVGDRPVNYSRAKTKIVVFTSLKHKISLDTLQDLTDSFTVSDGPNQVCVINVNVDFDPETVKSYYATKRTKYATLLDADKAMCSEFRVKFLPHVAIVSESGEIAEVYMVPVSADKRHMKGVIKDLKSGVPIKPRDIQI